MTAAHSPPKDSTGKASRLIAVGGAFSGEVFPLVGDVASFGREPTNILCLPDPALSRRHCEFVRLACGWAIRDLSSANGTFVNGLQVTEQALSDGDRLGLGGSVLLYVNDVAAMSAPAAELLEDSFAETRRLDLNNTSYLRAAEVSAGEPAVATGLRMLLRFTEIIHSIPNEPELHTEVLRLLFEAVPADEGAIVLLTEGGEYAPAATLVRDGDQPVRISMTAIRAALADGAAIGRMGLAPESIARPAGVTASTGATSVVTVPIVVRGQPPAAIYLAARGRAAFAEDHLQFVTAVARITGLAFENVRHLARLQRETERLQSDLQLSHSLVGESPPIRRAYERIARVARSDSTVLIVGETGTGKELAARAIHLNGARARRPFIAINCAALAEQLLESELFGHERGAFTGAIAQKKGRFELAQGGTLFLDEVGELAPALQSKLLRILQERAFERVGGTREIKADVRVISATNRNLPAEIARGRFREDLYFRLNVVSVAMPPLRERQIDIPVLARHFVAKHGRKCDRRIGGFSPEAMGALMSYDWPGNVRELENAIERAVVLGTTEEIVLEDLPDSIIESAVGRTGTSAPTIHGAVLDTKRRAIIDAFRSSGGSYTATARTLGVHPNYLHRLIRNLGIKSQLEA